MITQYLDELVDFDKLDEKQEPQDVLIIGLKEFRIPITRKIYSESELEPLVEDIMKFLDRETKIDYITEITSAYVEADTPAYTIYEAHPTMAYEKAKVKGPEKAPFARIFTRNDFAIINYYDVFLDLNPEQIFKEYLKDLKSRKPEPQEDV